MRDHANLYVDGEWALTEDLGTESSRSGGAARLKTVRADGIVAVGLAIGLRFLPFGRAPGLGWRTVRIRIRFIVGAGGGHGGALLRRPQRGGMRPGSLHTLPLAARLL